MVRFQFKRGLRFSEGVRRWELEKLNAVGKFVFEAQDEECERISLTLEEVHTLWLSGKWVIEIDSLGPGSDLVWHTTPASLSSLSPEIKAHVEPRARLLMAIRAHFESIGSPVKCKPELLTEIVKGRAKEFGLATEPHWSTIWRWWVRFVPTGCMTRLANATKSGRKIDQDKHAIFQEVVDEVFLTNQKRPGKHVVEEIERRYLILNRGLEDGEKINPPSRATIYRWVEMLHYSVVSSARNGKKFNERERRKTIGFLKICRILERFEIDHTPVDVFLVCEKTWMLLGRPWLTLVIDRHSRMIAGFYVGFHAPSATSVMLALRQAILPKEELLSQFPGVINPWPVRGCPSTLAMDNGMELHADAVNDFCLDALIELRFMGVAHPELKGAIERVFGTLSRDLFHTLPGTVFNNINARGDYPAEQQAALTLKKFTEVLLMWIVDVYHKTPHRGLKGHHPLAVWQSGESGAIFSYPAYPRQIDLMVAHRATRSVFHYGIDYDNVRYSSLQLLAIRDPRRDTPTVAIKVYDDDVGYIDVQDPDTQEYLRVPAVDLDYANGLNRDVHELIWADVRKRFGDKENREELLAVKAEIQRLVKDAVQSKKTGVRKKAAALQKVNSEANLDSRPANAFSIASQPIGQDDETEIRVYSAGDDLPSFQSLSDGSLV